VFERPHTTDSRISGIDEAAIDSYDHSLNEVNTMQLPTTLPDLLAQWQPGPHGPGPHGPHWGGGGAGMGGAGPGMGDGFGVVGGWWLVLLLALLVLGLAVAAAYLTTRTGGDGEDGALAVLRERYAAGDLDEEEFERRRERLTGGTG